MTCDDFRGIAISPLISKVFEYCILDRFEDFLFSSDAQFGFKKVQGVEMPSTRFVKLLIDLLKMVLL